MHFRRPDNEARWRSRLPIMGLPLLGCVVLLSMGCTRSQYRVQADRDAYDVIGGAAQRNVDRNAFAADYSIDVDPRSRFYDSYDPDCSPMPEDDPASHEYMQVVYGMDGWSHWLDNGVRNDLENPYWRESLGDFAEVADDGTVQLDIDSALRLAYLHSPEHQRQLETLYLSALDVTAERFRLDTQFFGGYDVAYRHDGSLIPASLRFDPASGRYVVSPPANLAGADSNRLTIGRQGAGNPALQFERRLATAGELLAGFANSFVFEFTGGDANLSASLANFTFIQPMLRGAGRDVALEQLTSVERDMLANLRAYGQYRQGFYTQIVIGELGVGTPQRGGRGTNVQVASQLSFLGGYIGLLQQLQNIRNSEDNLSLQLRTLEQLEALQSVGVIDLVQVDQFRQSIENERSRLLESYNDFERALDRYKTSTLGLPPDLPIVLDDSLTLQFQLVSRESTALQDSITFLQDTLGQFPDDPAVEDVQMILDDIDLLIEPVRLQLDSVAVDLDRMEQTVEAREESIRQSGLPQELIDEELLAFQADREQLHMTLFDIQTRYATAIDELAMLNDGLDDETRRATARRLVVWLGNLLRMTQRSVLVQARARLEAVTVDSVQLEPLDALDIALNNRLDFMNARAALVDQWRGIQVSADALQSVLNVTGGADIRTATNNPAAFRAPTGSFQLGLEFDAPLTRLLERNGYRAALIDFQQSRRTLIQSRDTLHLELRSQLRRIQQLEQNLEIQRRAVAIAIRRVDLTRAELYAPVPPPRPGQRAAQFGPTAAFNLLSALSSLRDTQNAFLSVWLNYYAAKMRLARELGLMELDQEGRWIERPLPSSDPIPESAAGNGQANLGFPPMIYENGQWVDSSRPGPNWDSEPSQLDPRQLSEPIPAMVPYRQ